MIEYNFPKSFWKIAEEIGNARAILNKEKYKKKTHNRGVKQKHVDTIGVLGELIALDYLTNNDIEFEMVDLVSKTPTHDADLKTRKSKIDIKTTEHFNGAHILVNELSHTKGKSKVDCYWFIYITDKTTAEFYTCSYDEISEWGCKMFGYTKAYYNKRENLKT